ncbi:MAG: DNA polymerase I [Planctomycetes bacterium]|nr:DNA polymerase I [Planctomycetota bacterium]NBY02432.1 DNA polymerase I [Planctomycetota bacterium]
MGNNPETMYLIDSMSLIFQVFHAIPNMTSPTGTPTNAVYGFTRDLMFLRDKKPDYIICGWDTPEPTFRNIAYPEYKAHRDEAPVDLIMQLPMIQQVLDAFNIPLISIAGFEADDILATIAEHAKSKGIKVYLVTSDKDCRQLIDDNVTLYNIRKHLEYGRAELLADWGITPAQVVDLQTLVGDTADNVPGAVGIGIKTASSLLQEFGTIENIYANMDKISGAKRKENLAAFAERVPMVRNLVTLDRNSPVPLDFEGWRLNEIDAGKSIALFRTLGFRGMLAQIEKSAPQGLGLFKQHSQPSSFIQVSSHIHPEIPSFTKSCSKLSIDLPIQLRGLGDWQYDYTLINNESDFEVLVDKLSGCKRFAFDTETTGLDPFTSKIAGISFCLEKGKASYVAIRTPEGESRLDESYVLDKLRPIFNNKSILKVNQNIKFDLLVMLVNGVTTEGVAGDSMIADYLLHSGERSHGLDEMAKRYLNHEMISITELIGAKGKNKVQKVMSEVNSEVVALYACEDSDAAFQLSVFLEDEISKTVVDGSKDRLADLYNKVEIPLVSVLARMQFRGICIDAEFLKILGVEMGLDLERLEKEIHTLAGKPFQISSLPQLRAVLYDDLKLPMLKKTGLSKEASTDQETLEKLAVLDHPGAGIPRKILEFRQLAKLKSTYVDAIPELIQPSTGRIHAAFNQTVTATGRLSSSTPNLQNIPVRKEMGQQIRKAFLPREGWVLVSADYSQIELRLLAHFCNDKNMIKAFEDEKDIHSQVASEIFAIPETMVSSDMRRTAKTVNFGIIYGISAHGLAQRLEIDRHDASRFIDAYFARYPNVLKYQDDLLARCRSTGYVSTILGRRRRIDGIRDRSTFQQRNQPEREAINMEIQGSAADLIKLAMIGVDDALAKNNLDSKLLLQIHDELVLECPKGEVEAVKKLLVLEMSVKPRKLLDLKVPITIEVSAGANWLAQEEIK